MTKILIRKWHLKYSKVLDWYKLTFIIASQNFQKFTDKKAKIKKTWKLFLKNFEKYRVRIK